MTEPIAGVEQHLVVTELRARINMALSVLAQRGHNADSARVVEDVLRGRSLRELVADQGRVELDAARQRGLVSRHAAKLRNLHEQADGA